MRSARDQSRHSTRTPSRRSKQSTLGTATTAAAAIAVAAWVVTTPALVAIVAAAVGFVALVAAPVAAVGAVLWCRAALARRRLKRERAVSDPRNEGYPDGEHEFRSADVRPVDES